jgi:putative glutamine amidotransferase
MSAARPLIGVPAQTLQAIDGIPPALPHSWVMNERYLSALASVGAVPVLVPLLDDDTETLRELYLRLDGLFIAGGVDVDPSSYRAVRHPATGRIDPARDAVELSLTRWALRDGMPVLGVCRGMQIINVACGGDLIQDTTLLFAGALKHDCFPTQGFARDYLAHDVVPEENSRVAQIFGQAPFPVNSMHHQGVSIVADPLVATARAPDGLIEAIETRGDDWVVGVQWHPESLLDRDARTRALFTEFVAAARQYGQSSARGRARLDTTEVRQRG